MKKLYILLIAVLSLAIFSCEKEEFDDVAAAQYEYVGVSTSRIATSVLEGTGVSNTVPVTVYYGNDVAPGRPIEVTFTVADGSTAQLGSQFTIDGASSVSGQSFTVTIPEDTFQTTFGIVTEWDLEQNDDYDLTLDITSVSDGVDIGYPFDDSFSLEILDDDCDYDISKILTNLSGTDITIDGLEWDPYESQVEILGSVGDYRITGLGVGWMTDFWGEVIITMEEVEMQLENEASITIPEQDYMTTTYQGDPQPLYTIVGSGTVDKCAGVIRIEYTLKQGDSDWAAWTNAEGYMSDELFTAVLELPE